MKKFSFIFITAILAVVITPANTLAQAITNPHLHRSISNTSLVGLDTGRHVTFSQSWIHLPFFGDMHTTHLGYEQRLKNTRGSFAAQVSHYGFPSYNFLGMSSSTRLKLTYNHILKETQAFTWTAGLTFTQSLQRYRNQKGDEFFNQYTIQTPLLNSAIRVRNFYAGLSFGVIGFTSNVQQQHFYGGRLDLTMGYDYQLGKDLKLNAMVELRSMTNPMLAISEPFTLSLKLTYREKLWLSGAYSMGVGYGVSAGYMVNKHLGFGLGYHQKRYNPFAPSRGVSLQMKCSF